MLGKPLEIDCSKEAGAQARSLVYTCVHGYLARHQVWCKDDRDNDYTCEGGTTLDFNDWRTIGHLRDVVLTAYEVHKAQILNTLATGNLHDLIFDDDAET